MFDLGSGDLRTPGGASIRIQQKPLQVLRLLLEGEGRVVTREQLRLGLWTEETFVDFEHGVNTAVRKLRQVLDDSAENPKFIETLPKVGYRFIAPVEWVAGAGRRHGLPSVVPITSPGPTPVAEPATKRDQWTLASAAAVAVLVAGAAITLTYQNSYLSRTRLGLVLRQALVGPRSEPQPALRQRPLTANPDETPVTGGVISPDGKYLAYADSTGLYLRQVEGGETHAIPLPKDFDAFPESWFPDSFHLVVSRLEPGKGPPSLWVTSLMGGMPRMLADVGSYARVSPDGSEIAFLRGMWDNEEIWLMQADGNNARKRVDGGADQFGPIAWAPDEKRFASARTTNPFGPDQPGKRVEVYDVANGQGEAILLNRAVGDDGSTNWGVSNDIAWAPDGRLVYSLQEAEPNQEDSNLWSVQLDPRTSRPSGPPTRITNDRSFTGRISITSDGKRMALLRGSEQADVYLAELVAHGERLRALRRFTLDARFDLPSAWTLDSLAVLFISNRDGPVHIFRQKIDQTQPDLLVGGTDIQMSPRLTPDGASALYGISRKPGDPPANIPILRVPILGGPSQFVVESPGIEI